MVQKILQKKEFDNFINQLIKKYEVVAPIKDKITKFSKIKNSKEIYLDDNTLVPLKQLFMPEKEVLFEFKKGKIKKIKPDSTKRIVFGIRKCDLNSLLILDKVMFDPLYKSKRENTVLIGMFCDNPSEYCFCNSMELVDYYDLYFYPEGDKYYISVGSKKGEFLVKGLKDADKEVKKEIKNTKQLKNKDIYKEYMNPLWNKDIEKCLSCGACTIYCPTCNCFDIRDEDNLDKSGKRVRIQTSCQLKSFSEVAGGKSFRDSRASRFKHFVYHKIVFYKNKFNKYMCVGCGRCLKACPPKIDWVETINQMNGGKK